MAFAEKKPAEDGADDVYFISALNPGESMKPLSEVASGGELSRVMLEMCIRDSIKGMFERDFVLKRIRVKGEVSNCKYHGSGHIYFTLKDSEAQINCVMFRSSRDGLTFIMKDGQQIEATGQISVYEKGGSYQDVYKRQVHCRYCCTDTYIMLSIIHRIKGLHMTTRGS